MKILQINSVCDYGSTGRTTRELADYLESHGHECYVAYGHGTTTFHNSMKIGSVFENHFHNLFFTRALGLHGYGTYFGTKRLIQWIEHIKPDIVHLQNLHANYLNFPLLFKYLVDKQIPVVFTLHDCFNFTGKCAHYTAINCYKWKKECQRCPTFRHCVAPSALFDNSRRLFNQKERFYSQMNNLTVVAVSKWLANEARQSAMFSSARKITHIYNWIDFNKFHRATESELASFYQKYNLSREYKYLISVSQGWDNNASRYRDAIRLARKLPEKYKLVLIGSVLRGSRIEEPIIHIPYINGSSELAVAYTMAEAYIHLSVEDTFGKVIAEAMTCGTIPITFNSTACGETPGPFGAVVAPHDIDAIVEILGLLPELQEQRENMLEYVRNNYDYHTNAHKYIELYEDLLMNRY